MHNVSTVITCRSFAAKLQFNVVFHLTNTPVILLHSHYLRSFFSMHTNTCRNTDWLHWHGGHKYTLGSLWVKPGGEQPEQTIPLATSADGLRTFHLPFISICIIPMHSVTGGELYPIQWEAVGRLELMGFHVLGVTCDGLAANRKLIRLHSTATGVVYKTVNPYAPDKRPLFFLYQTHPIWWKLSEMLGKKRTYGLVLQNGFVVNIIS